MDKLTQTDANSHDIVADNIDKLKAIFPEAFTEGKIDFDVLKETLGEYRETREERYNFSWAGKSKARRLTQTPTTGTLRPCPEESVDWDKTENLFIEGDNLEVLKLLQKSYQGQVKMIYIDPPYNTGGDFVYPDKYADNLKGYLEYTNQVDADGNKQSSNTEASGRFHSNWLNMMLPRLHLAKNLLKEDGVIFVSIDENELTNLTKLCNDIFGEENYVGLFSVENNPKGRKNSRFISVTNDYCVIYAKNKEVSSFVENIPKNASDMTEDENGNFVHNSGKRVLVGENSFNNLVSNFSSEKHYSVYYLQDTKDVVIEVEKEVSDVNTALIESGYRRYSSTRRGEFIENTYTKSKFLELYQAGALEFQSEKIFEKNFSSSIRIKSILRSRDYEGISNGKKTDVKIDFKTTSAGTHLKELFGTSEVVFPAPKNVSFLKTLITLFNEPKFTVVDFFCGSATTAHAVMKVNAEKGKSLKYIMVQIPELCDEKSEAAKAGFKTISSLSRKRIRLSADEVKREHPEYAGDLGFKAFKLDSSNIEAWDSNVENLEDNVLNAANVLKDGRSELDIVYELFLKYGLDLSYPVNTHEVAGKQVYEIGAGSLFICLEDGITTDFVEALIKLYESFDDEAAPRVVFKDSGFKTDAAKKDAESTLKDAGILDVKCL